jgi:lysozyme family protein
MSRGTVFRKEAIAACPINLGLGANMAAFKPAFMFTLHHEDPSGSGKVTEDAGGRTRFGIAAKYHPDLPEDFFTGPVEKALAEAERIEEQEYWLPMRLGEVENQDVANKLFDMGVNMGILQAGIYAQRAANALLGRTGSGSSALTEDGNMGGKTLAAINGLVPIELYELLRALSEEHYRRIAGTNPGQAGNLQGWLKRANA